MNSFYRNIPILAFGQASNDFAVFTTVPLSSLSAGVLQAAPTGQAALSRP